MNRIHKIFEASRLSCKSCSVPNNQATRKRAKLLKGHGVSLFCFFRSPPSPCLLLLVSFIEDKEHGIITRRGRTFPEPQSIAIALSPRRMRYTLHVSGKRNTLGWTSSKVAIWFSAFPTTAALAGQDKNRMTQTRPRILPGDPAPVRSPNDAIRPLTNLNISTSLLCQPLVRPSCISSDGCSLVER